MLYLPNKEILQFSVKEKKFFGVKPLFPKSLIRWSENFCPCCLVYKCMRWGIFHTICVLVCDFLFGLCLFVYFSQRSCYQKNTRGTVRTQGRLYDGKLQGINYTEVCY